MNAERNIEKFDVIVVGSGFGGSVNAARLADKGFNTLILERGPWWGPGNQARPKNVRRKFPRGLFGYRKIIRNIRKAQNGKSSEKLLNKYGLLEFHKFDKLTSVTSSGVGGGSHIFTSIYEKPDDEFFDHYPPEIQAQDMQTYFNKVLRMIRPMPIPDKPEKNKVFERAVKQAGLPEPVYPKLGVVFGKNPREPQKINNEAGVTQQTSTYKSDVFVGCNDGSKTTMDLTYIPQSILSGAQLRPLCEVSFIEKQDHAYIVGYKDHKTGKTARVKADRVVLAAGCLNTLRLLFRARDKDRTLPDISKKLGHGFSPNGDMSAFVWRSKILKDASYGTPFNAFTKRMKNGKFRYLVGEVGLPVDALPLPWPLTKWLKRSTFLFGMGADASRGLIEFDGENLKSSLDKTMDEELFNEIEKSMDKISEGYQPRKVKKRDGLFTVHPMGGCAIGNSINEAVTDHRGEVFNYPGLFVADGSLYPKSPGIPPSLTIAALAERQASLID